MRITDLAAFDYSLPPELIRKKGVEPRDAARLFVYDTVSDTVTFDVFRNLATHLPERALVVLNDTRVVPARLFLTKETGGNIEVFVLMNEYDGGMLIPTITDRKAPLGRKLLFPDGSHFIVRLQDENRFGMELVSKESLTELLERFGTTPIPHYLEDEGHDESALRQRYQTIFANAGASVAAPTASLHFTDAVFASLREKNIATTTVSLDVGLGTFAPLTEVNFTDKRLHRERYDIPHGSAEAIRHAKQEARAIVAVGTTVTRVLESAWRENALEEGHRETDIFILSPYRFQVPDMLLTNFHLPKSSLMLLVQAFLEHKQAKRTLVSLYEEAIREGFAFYSFGDSMLIR